MRSISNDATLQSLELKEALRRIDSAREFCLMDNKFKYEQDSADAYEEFTNCILGSVPVPRGSVDCKCLY